MISNILFGLYHEDFGLTPTILLLAKSVVSTDIYGYNYVQTSNSITRNEEHEKTLKKAYDNLIHYDNMIRKIENLDITENGAKKIKSYYSNAIILKTATLNQEDVDKYIAEIKKRKLTNDVEAKNIKQKIKKIILKISIKLYLKIKI